MRLRLVTAALSAWMARNGYEHVRRTSGREPGVCLTAATRGGITAAVIRPRPADKREYGALLSRIERAQSKFDRVYVSTTRRGMYHTRPALMTRGVGVLVVGGGGEVTVELEPRQV